MYKIDSPDDWVLLQASIVQPFGSVSVSKRRDRFHVTGPVTIWVSKDKDMVDAIPLLASPCTGLYMVESRFKGQIFVRVDVPDGAQCQVFAHLPKRAQVRHNDPSKQIWTGLPVHHARDPALERMMLMEQQRQQAWEQQLKTASDNAARSAVEEYRSANPPVEPTPPEPVESPAEPEEVSDD